MYQIIMFIVYIGHIVNVDKKTNVKNPDIFHHHG